jgi:hypothetical protein
MESSKIAQKTFELENRIQVLKRLFPLARRNQKTDPDPTLFCFVEIIQPLQQDQIFKYNAEEQKAIQKEAKWKKDPHYFKKVKISGVALIKMVSQHKRKIA